jgi:hypothetical protein
LLPDFITGCCREKVPVHEPAGPKPAATLRRLFRHRIFFSRMRANGATPRNQIAAGRGI